MFEHIFNSLSPHFAAMFNRITCLIFVGKGAAVDVRSVAAALDVDEQGRVRRDLPLLVVEARQVHPAPDILRGDNSVDALGPRVPAIEYAHLKAQPLSFLYFHRSHIQYLCFRKLRFQTA